MSIVIKKKFSKEPSLNLKYFLERRSLPKVVKVKRIKLNNNKSGGRMSLPIQSLNVEPMQLDLQNENNDDSIGQQQQLNNLSNANNLELNTEFNQSLASYTVENSTIDIEAYAINYNGWNKILRLLFIVEHSHSLKIEALKIVLNYIKENTYNTQLYTKIYFNLQQTVEKQLQGDVKKVEQAIGALDQQWIEQNNKRAQMKLEKLDTDLKNSKSNSIKESIRRGHDDLGDHYLDMGDLNNALKCYVRSRDYCTNSKHVLSMCLNAIKISIYLKNWSFVTSYVVKAENNTDFNPQSQIATRLNCASGLAYLANRKYDQAAKCFLLCNFDHFTNDSNDFLSVNNVATYGALCALASFSREQLLKQVLQSVTFKLFLETEPQLREALNKFYDSKYANCLSILDDLKDNFLLDLYLAAHVKTLYSSIRNRALIQYFSPYISAEMNKMAISFNTNVKSLEDEIMQLILDGQIQARIDSQNKILYAKDIDPRTVTFEKAIQIGKECHLRTKALLLRQAVIKHGSINIRSFNGGNSGMSRMDEMIFHNV